MQSSSHEYDLSAATWHKSTYSGGSGGDCLEVARDFPGAATWHKSTYSGGDGGNCLEVARDFPGAASWRKSTYSGASGGNCLEVATGLTGIVPVRDSKTPTSPALVFRAGTWATFVNNVKATV
ncbi:DUF397 domain-containing protein [Streptomyces sp. NPDC093109]|uniref:DUF397 domain-containing protein n=1 Tax=Streptomyces sp. NPDC093109 TaxID=3154977 RepID=UPI00344BAC24